MDEKDLKLMANKLYKDDDVYILLSTRNANMFTGESQPYMGMLKDGRKILLVFTTYEYARKYVDSHGYEVLEGVYPIARIDRWDKYRNLYEICNTALQMGVELMDVDPGSEQAVGFEIAWFMKVNFLRPKEASVLLTKAEMENLDGKIPLRMNMMPILDFKSPFIISEERKKEILSHIYAENPYMMLMENETLHENCYLMDVLNTEIMPKEKSEGNPNMDQFYRINVWIMQIIWDKLANSNLFVAVENDTKEVHVKNDSLYVIYTDFYKYMAPYEYRRVNDRTELVQIIIASGVEKIVVTSGPHKIAVLELKYVK